MNTCKNCGKAFESTNRTGPKRTKFCSNTCTYKHRNTKRSKGRAKTCPMCKCEFKDGSTNNNRIYCYGECGPLRGFHLKYGLSLKEYKKLDFSKCKICKIESGKMCVDHCHKTNKVRGILCHKCNTAIGLLNDDVQNLKSAVEYLNEVKL